MEKKTSSKSKKVPQPGAVCNSSAQEMLELNLREGLLDMEDRIYAGSLGAIKVGVSIWYPYSLLHNKRPGTFRKIPKYAKKSRLL